MNSVYIIIAIALWFFIGYKVYGRFLEKRLKISNRNETPASSGRKDKVDYSPSSKPFLIGHHFASIAGAGPIIGPILAISYFGWLPVVLWVSLGSVLIGAMHDYVTLIASVRNKGKGVSRIAEDMLGMKSGWVFGFMIWVTLILIITVFSVSSAESLVEKPEIIVPLIGITIIAFILGVGVQRYKWNYKIASFFALIAVLFTVYLGTLYPISLPIENENLLRNVWVSIIIGYAAIVSIIPIAYFLRPRDFVDALQTWLILALGIVALIVVRPLITAPAYQASSFPLWPILFVTVACGAVSGFHGLVSSGTTSKQLSKESDGKAIGYGGMLLEGVLAVFVTLIVISGVKWGASIPGGFQESLSKGWIVLFSNGYGNIVYQLGLPFISLSLASLLGAYMVNQFILTTVDSSTRIGRLVMSETLFPKLKNKLLTTAITLVPAWIIAVTNSYETLWRLFGASNQLIASISLITVAAYFTSKKIKTKFIAIPAMFVLVTTLSALAYMTLRSQGFIANGNYVLAAVSSVMFLLGIVVAYEGFHSIFKIRRQKK